MIINISHNKHNNNDNNHNEKYIDTFYISKPSFK